MIWASALLEITASVDAARQQPGEYMCVGESPRFDTAIGHHSPLVFSRADGIARSE
jgi:hypothetical protein